MTDQDGELSAADETALAIDVSAAKQFLAALALDESTLTFQTFADGQQNRKLARIMHGSFARVARGLADLNRAGAGVFVMVNRGDGKGRSAANVIAVRALFVDLDGAPLDPVRDAALAPHLIVESSPGRYHGYWRVADCTLEQFPIYQQALAVRFSGDPSVHDLPRVMRVPGYIHQKKEPFRSRIVVQQSTLPAYLLSDVVAAFELDAAVPRGPAVTTRLGEIAPDAEPGAKIGPGERNTTLTRLAGKLRQHGLSEEALAAALHAHNQERCDPPLEPAEVDAIAHSVSRYAASVLGASRVWPPLLLPSNRTVPDLPADLLPDWLGETAAAIADSTQTPPAAALMLVLAVIAAVLQRRFEVSPWDDEYRETLSLWVLVALPSGARKTAVLAPLLAPLFRWEKQQRDGLRHEIARTEAARGVAKRRIERLQADAAKADTAEARDALTSELQQVIEATPDELRPPRLVTGDTTTERLQGLLVEQRERIALFSDESGIFAVLAGLYSGGQMHLDAFLQAHSGAPIRVDRAARSAHVDRPALSFGLALQPKVLQEVADVRRFRDSGLLARFLYVLPESLVGKRDVRQRAPIPARVINQYELNIGQLLEGAGDKATAPRILVLTEAARDCWLDFAGEIELAMAPGASLDAIADWASKLPGAAVRIGGLLQLAVAGVSATQVELATMQRAIELARRLIPHALATFRLLGADEKEADALVLLRWILAERHVEFDRSHAHKALESRFRTVDRLKAAAARLAEWNVLSEECFRTNVSARPTPYYLVNPQLFADSTDSQSTE